MVFIKDTVCQEEEEKEEEEEEEEDGEGGTVCLSDDLRVRRT